MKDVLIPYTGWGKSPPKESVDFIIEKVVKAREAFSKALDNCILTVWDQALKASNELRTEVSDYRVLERIKDSLLKRLELEIADVPELSELTDNFFKVRVLVAWYDREPKAEDIKSAFRKTALFTEEIIDLPYELYKAYWEGLTYLESSSFERINLPDIVPVIVRSLNIPRIVVDPPLQPLKEKNSGIMSLVALALAGFLSLIGIGSFLSK